MSNWYSVIDKEEQHFEMFLGDARMRHSVPRKPWKEKKAYHLSDVSFTKLLGTVMVGKEACGLLFVKEDGWTVIVGQWLHCLYRLTDENIFLLNFGFPYNLVGFLHLDFLLWIFSEINFSDFISFFPSHSKSGCCSTVRETNSIPTTVTPTVIKHTAGFMTSLPWSLSGKHVHSRV